MHGITKTILETILPLGINFSSAFLLVIHAFHNMQLFVESAYQKD